MCFVDFKKAFDSISHDKLWMTLMDMGYPLHLFISLSPPDNMPDLDNLTRCIDYLHIWFCANGMALNPDKSEAILLGTRQQAHSYSSLSRHSQRCRFSDPFG